MSSFKSASIRSRVHSLRQGWISIAALSLGSWLLLQPAQAQPPETRTTMLPEIVVTAQRLPQVATVLDPIIVIGNRKQSTAILQPVVVVARRESKADGARLTASASAPNTHVNSPYSNHLGKGNPPKASSSRVNATRGAASISGWLIDPLLKGAEKLIHRARHIHSR